VLYTDKEGQECQEYYTQNIKSSAVQ